VLKKLEIGQRARKRNGGGGGKGEHKADFLGYEVEINVWEKWT